jgi:hypothetical protein
MIASEKKYQVFVSSTYEDLRVERQEVIQALLELDCIPSGMELFPAANEDQWTLIKSVIDECDYYIVIVAGRYGSIGPSGLSYTEMEYRYALERGKPTIGFLHKKPGDLPAKHTEPTPEGKERLKAFGEMVSTKNCKFWNNASELGSVVSRSLIVLQRTFPAVGWIRGDVATDKEASLQIVKLNRELEELRKQLDDVRTQAPPGTEQLSQGEDLVSFSFSCLSTKPVTDDEDDIPWGEENFDWDDQSVLISWNDIFYELSPLMIHEATDLQLKRVWEKLVEKRAAEKMRSLPNADGHTFARFKFDDSEYQTVKVQLRALGLIVQSQRNRSVKDTTAYWTLTPYGDETMNRIRAIRKRRTTEELLG